MITLQIFLWHQNWMLTWLRALMIPSSLLHNHLLFLFPTSVSGWRSMQRYKHPVMVQRCSTLSTQLTSMAYSVPPYSTMSNFATLFMLEPKLDWKLHPKPSETTQTAHMKPMRTPQSKTFQVSPFALLKVSNSTPKVLRKMNRLLLPWRLDRSRAIH